MNAKANFGKQILIAELNGKLTPSRLAARKNRLIQIAESFELDTLRDGHNVLEEIYDLAKADDWDFAKDGPEGQLDQSTLGDIIDACLAAKLGTDYGRSYHAKPAEYLERFFSALQSQLKSEGL